MGFKKFKHGQSTAMQGFAHLYDKLEGLPLNVANHLAMFAIVWRCVTPLACHEFRNKVSTIKPSFVLM